MILGLKGFPQLCINNVCDKKSETSENKTILSKMFKKHKKEQVKKGFT